MGSHYIKGKYVKKSVAQAFKYYKSSADQGNKQAQYQVAECFRQGGYDFKESWKEALVYYKLAAEQGHIQAIRFLFKCYHYGQGVAESQKAALKYLKLGAELKDPECQYQLGNYYENGGGGLTPSLTEALKLLRLRRS
jgi:TPR repeat protein